jgi:hypothetical protein
MNEQNRNELITRESLINHLSDDEVARVSLAETKANLVEGDLYLDLEQLELGVLTAHGQAPAMGQILPRKAVQARTWDWITTQLAAAPPMTARP